MGDRSRDKDFAGLDDEDKQQESVAATESRFTELLLIVGLTATSIYSFMAYLDVRNKYRAALRGSPMAGGLAA